VSRKRAIGFALTLPRSLSPGRFQLVVTVSLLGGRYRSTRTLTIAFIS
jgi:hypothetical protein